MACACGQEKCNGLCNYAVGKRLALFLKEIDVIQTKIGDMDTRKSSYGSLIVTGIDIYADGSQSTIMKPSADVTISMEDRFNNYNGKSPRALLKEYIEKAGIENGRSLLLKMRDIEENKLLLMPFKTKQICDVVHTRVSKREDVNGKHVECRTNIESVKWSIANNEDKLQCVLIVSMVDPDTTKRVKLNITDYCDTFNLVDLERLHAKSNIQGQIIKMTKFGYVKPLQIDYNGTSVVIDNSTVYVKYKEDSDFRAVGSWTAAGTISLEEPIREEKIEKAINLNTSYISKHRRWIAPYGLCETNKLTVK